MEYKWVGTHAQDTLDGRMLAPGETVELSEEDLRESHYEQLIADDLLIPLGGDAEHEAQLASRRVSRRKGPAERPVPGEQVPDPESDEGGDS